MGATVLGALISGPGAAPALAGTAATPASAGTASATATSYKVNPTTASLSIGIAFGLSLAGYTNNVAQAESRGIDLGIIGSTLAAQGCDGGDPTLPADQQPQPLRADSRTTPAGVHSEQEKWIPLITKSVQASSTPFGEADTTTAALSGGGVVEFGATQSKAVTQLVNGTREAIATVDIASVKIAGVVELAGLHWRAVYRSGAIDATEGSFTIGSFKVGGQDLPTGDPTAAFAAANTILNTLGIQIQQPTPRTAAGFLFVDPLVVRVVPNAQRDAITGGALGAIHDQRESLYDQLLEMDCGNASYITVSDIVVGSLTGAGSFGIELGGVQAKAEPLKTSNFLNGTPLASGIGDDLGGFDAFDSNDTLSALPDASSTPPTAVLDKRGDRGPQLAATGKGTRGGKLAAVGLMGLAGLLLFAERDRRMMRRAQRISLEA